MNKHDSMCPTFSANPLDQELDGKWLCQCEMIQRIRLDILNNKYYDDEIEWEQAYKAGYEDAMKDCNMTYEDFKIRRNNWNALLEELNVKGRNRNER